MIKINTTTITAIITPLGFAVPAVANGVSVPSVLDFCAVLVIGAILSVVCAAAGTVPDAACDREGTTLTILFLISELSL